MSFISLEQLPFVGMAHEFVGEKARPSRRTSLIACQAVAPWRGLVVIPANTPHRFVNSGDTTLLRGSVL
jgi:hypothetical protein